MKPNGMRAWRRLAKRWRRKQNRHNRETGCAPAFRTWSLVGMTQGARKQSIRTERAPTRALLARFGVTDQHAGYIERLCACKDPAAGHDVTCRADACSDHLPHSGDPCVVCESNDAEFAAHLGQADELLRLRAKYRIGERLRPCLICQWAKCKLPCDVCSTCDGSGVLPAGRR